MRNLTINLFKLMFILYFLAIQPVHTKDNNNALKIEVTEFEQVESKLKSLNQKHGVEQVLVVLDIDNTILTSSVDLGGDVWYQWQRGKLEIKPSDDQKVKCLFEDSIGLLYELLPMNLTEEDLSKRISNWQKNGNTLMALTSRAPKYRAATERELAAANVDLEKTALAPKNGQIPIYREMKGRELSYMKGIMMTSGMNKGDMLEHILNKTNRSFKAIIFVDDSKKNIDNLYKKFKDSQNLEMYIYHYTRVEEARKEKHGSVITSNQVKKMDDDWKKLNKVLNEIFPERNIGDACLSN